MLIRAVDVTSFRVLGRVRVELSRGLNVVYGENDTGKTTLMNAIKDVLTQRAKVGGAVQKAMQPRDGSTPEIAIDFEHRGVEYSVRKRFAGAKGTARLVARHADGRTVDVSGEDAEAELRSALGLGEAKKRGDAPGGIWPLLWIDQGTSALAPSLNDDTRLALSDRLSAMSGAVLAGAGAETLFFSARTEYRKWFTESGKPATDAGASLHAAEVALDEAKARRDDLAARLREHETKVDRHAALVREVDKVAAFLPELERAAIAAEARAREVDAHGERLDKARTEARAAEHVAAAAEARVVARTKAREAVSEREAARAALAEKVREADAIVARHDAGRAELDAGVRAAEAALAERETEHRAARARLDAATARRELGEVDAKLARARSEHEAMIALQARSRSLEGAESARDAVEKHEKALERAELALEAAAAIVEVRALGAAKIEIDGATVTLEAGEATERRADAPTTVRVPGVVEVRVTPGGKDLVRARADAEGARAALARALDAAHAEDVAQARARADEKRRVDAEARTKAELVALVAPEGIDALEAVRAKHAALVAASGDGDAGVDAAAARVDLDAAERARDAARAALDAARERTAGHDLARQRLDGDARVAHKAAESAERAAEEATAALARSIAEDGEDATLGETRARAVTALEAHRRAADALAAELKRMAPDDAASTAERARRAYEAALAEQRAKSTDANVLFGELRSADLFGLHERLGAAAASVDECEAEVARLTERAEATRLLFETLADCRAAAQRAFVQPLQREIAPLLQALFAESDVRLDDRFGVEAVTRAQHGVDEFEALGGGAREQLAILVRLGMASVLAGDDTLPVLLDDAIVFSSEERFSRMQSVLARVARRLQIVLFTCHWERYRALGADNAVDLAALLRARA